MPRKPDRKSKSQVRASLRKYQKGRIALPARLIEVDQAVKDFRREKVILNGVKYVPDTPRGSPEFLRALGRLLSDLSCGEEKCTSSNQPLIFKEVLTRASRTCTGIILYTHLL